MWGSPTPVLVATDPALHGAEVNGHGADAKPSLGRHRCDWLTVRGHRPVVWPDVPQHHFPGLAGMRFDRGDDGVMVAVTVQVVRGYAAALGQDHRAARQLEQRRPGRNLAAVPAAQPGIVGVVEDRCRAPAARPAVTPADLGPP